MPQLSIKLEG